MITQYSDSNAPRGLQFPQFPWIERQNLRHFLKEFRALLIIANVCTCICVYIRHGYDFSNSFLFNRIFNNVSRWFHVFIRSQCVKLLNIYLPPKFETADLSWLLIHVRTLIAWDPRGQTQPLVGVDKRGGSNSIHVCSPIDFGKMFTKSTDKNRQK